MRITLSRDRIDAARRARRAARRTAAIGYRSIVVPLLGHGETEHALDLACRLAARRGAKVLLVAPIVAPHALPLDAHFEPETAELREWLAHAEAIAAKAHGVSPEDPPRAHTAPPPSGASWPKSRVTTARSSSSSARRCNQARLQRSVSA